MSQHNVRLLSVPDSRAARAGVPLVPSALKEHLPILLQIENVGPLEDATLRAVAASHGAIIEEVQRSGKPGPQNVYLLSSRESLGSMIKTLRATAIPTVAGLAADLAEALDNLSRPPAPMTIRNKTFSWGKRTCIMGILNVTPDSFSGDGLLSRGLGDVLPLAVEQGLRFLTEGADIIDIGGESTRPGAEPVDADTERARVVPVIASLRRQTDAPISVDTYKASVARAALEAGADIVNDIWGLQMDHDLAQVVAEAGVPLIIMHNHSKRKYMSQEPRLGPRYTGTKYDDLMGDILRELRWLLEQATTQGVDKEQIIIDPGIGFGKTVSQNLYLLNHVDELQVIGRPVLVGPSRKSFIGYTLDLPPEERLEGTAAAIAVAVLRGADIVRVHDVRFMSRVVRMTDTIVRANPS